MLGCGSNLAQLRRGGRVKKYENSLSSCASPNVGSSGLLRGKMQFKLSQTCSTGRAATVHRNTCQALDAANNAIRLTASLVGSCEYYMPMHAQSVCVCRRLTQGVVKAAERSDRLRGVNPFLTAFGGGPMSGAGLRKSMRSRPYLECGVGAGFFERLGLVTVAEAAVVRDFESDTMCAGNRAAGVSTICTR